MTVLLHAQYSVALFRDDGSMRAEGREGLYDVDTRLLGAFRYTLDGRDPQLVGSQQPAAHRWRARLIAPSPTRDADPSGPALPQDVIELDVDRAVGPGLVDRLTIRNASGVAASVTLGIHAVPDFADVQEVGGERRQRGSVRRDGSGEEVSWHYAVEQNGATFRRAVRLRLEGAEGARSGSADRPAIEVTVELRPHAAQQLTATVESLVDGRWRSPQPDRQDAWLSRWDRQRSTVKGEGGDLICRAVDRAARDLGALRNDDLFGGSDTAWFPNAGVPAFTGFFGRDALTAAWQAGLLSAAPMRGAIEVAARTQATEDDPWRDAEPNKLVHEIRRGPLSILNVIPQAAYYGTQTTPAMFVVALSEYWQWTGDLAFVRRHLGTALATFEWARRFGDLDGDGFLEYRRRSPKGLANQGWKDSDEAIRRPDGGLVSGPIATVEEQAFHHLALERMAELLVAVGDDSRAEVFLDQARELRSAWDDAFWLDDEAFYALALDGQKRPVASITSNPGHALGAGLVPTERARAVADRLMAPDLFSGWGIRTLSSEHPSYNPYAYHLGTVWPVEQATFALGFKRYGLDDHVDRLVTAVLEAAARFPGGRLPELLAGVPRDAFPEPVSYPDANAPQAWSAGATVQLLQATLGLYPFAPLGVLALVDPRLPASVPSVTIQNIRVGRARISLRFDRRDDGSARHHVQEQHGRVLVVDAGPPNAPGGGPWLQRLERLALRRSPGRRIRAARIAVGLER